jgi:hypothetical protein
LKVFLDMHSPEIRIGANACPSEMKKSVAEASEAARSVTVEVSATKAQGQSAVGRPNADSPSFWSCDVGEI